MMINSSKNRLGLALSLAIIAFLFLASYFLKKNFRYETVSVSLQESALNFNADFLKVFSAGQKRVFSDVFWIKTLLDSDQEHYQGNDLNSWMYLRFKTIALLDPLFKSNYIFGGRYLSIIKDDVEGANDILLSGLDHFPKDKQMIEMLAFNYTFELGDYKNGYHYYKILSTFPSAPEYIKSLMVKIQTAHAPNVSEALSSLRSIYADIEDKESAFAFKIKTDIANLTIGRDLDCLNSGQSGCSLIDPHGNRYRSAGGRYLPPPNYKPYELQIRKQRKERKDSAP